MAVRSFLASASNAAAFPFAALSAAAADLASLALACLTISRSDLTGRALATCRVKIATAGRTASLAANCACCSCLGSSSRAFVEAASERG